MKTICLVCCMLIGLPLLAREEPAGLIAILVEESGSAKVIVINVGPTEKRIQGLTCTYREDARRGEDINATAENITFEEPRVIKSMEALCAVLLPPAVEGVRVTVAMGSRAESLDVLRVAAGVPWLDLAPSVSKQK